MNHDKVRVGFDQLEVFLLSTDNNYAHQLLSLSLSMPMHAPF